MLKWRALQHALKSVGNAPRALQTGMRGALALSAREGSWSTRHGMGPPASLHRAFSALAGDGSDSAWTRRSTTAATATTASLSTRWTRTLCLKQGDIGQYREPKPLPANDSELERIPVPDGIPTDRTRIYTVRGSGRDYKALTGEDGLFGVHGPTKLWAPYGLVEGHGACGGMFAVIMSGGRQYQVIEGDVLYSERVTGEVNTVHVFEDVLMLGAVDWTWIGRPCIARASVVATIEEQARTGKIYITKFKKRKGYRRRQGHRQKITRFRIDEIRYEMPTADRFEPRDDWSLGPHVQPKNFEPKF